MTTEPNRAALADARAALTKASDSIIEVFEDGRIDVAPLESALDLLLQIVTDLVEWAESVEAQ